MLVLHLAVIFAVVIAAPPRTVYIAPSTYETTTETTWENRKMCWEAVVLVTVIMIVAALLFLSVPALICIGCYCLIKRKTTEKQQDLSPSNNDQDPNNNE